MSDTLTLQSKPESTQKMKATLKLDPANSRMEFTAEDFFLRFSVTNLLQRIDEVLEVDNGFVAFMANGEEEHIELSDLTAYLKLDWDFSGYDLEVLT